MPTAELVWWRIVGEPLDWHLQKVVNEVVTHNDVRSSEFQADLVDFARNKGMMPLEHQDGRVWMR